MGKHAEDIPRLFGARHERGPVGGQGSESANPRIVPTGSKRVVDSLDRHVSTREEKVDVVIVGEVKVSLPGKGGI
jgi:hypothetical protein